MNNFLRTVRVALRNRGTLVGVLVTSLLVGGLWGANIGIVYPFVEVIFQRRSLHEWIDAEIIQAKANVADVREQVERQRRDGAGLPATQPGDAALEIASLERRLEVEAARVGAV